MRAICKIFVGGQDITSRIEPLLIDLSISDRAGASSDSASMTIDDRSGQIVMPGPRAPVQIFLGWEGGGVALAFSGVVDEIRSNGGRGGRRLSIGAKGMDTRGKAKQGQRKHFDDKTIGDAMSAAAQEAGISVSVDPAFASIKRKYIALDDESFVAFGERMARELGGTFKIVGDRAVLAKRNGGASPSGLILPTVFATWGSNLHSWDITPIIGRPVEKEALARYYDPKSAEWKEEKADTGTADAETTKPSRYSEADQDRAKEQASSDAAESDRQSGQGSVTIEGNTDAQPEGLCVVAGARPGVDGVYRIEGVDHRYSRGGFTTGLDLRQPKGEAGKDSR